MDSTKSDEQLHIVMFPHFAFGHVSPFVQLSNKFTSYGIKVSFFSIPGCIPKIKSIITPSSNTQIIPLQIPSSIEGLNPNVSGTSDLPITHFVKLLEASDLMQSEVKSILSQLKPNLVIFEHFQQWIPQIASQLGIKTVFFSVCSAISNAYLYVPSRLSGVGNQNGKKPTVSDLMKCPPGFPENSSAKNMNTFAATDFMVLFMGPLTSFERFHTSINGSSAIILKSCEEMEGPYIDYLKTQFKKPIILTGPLVPEPPKPCSENLDKELDTWLSQFSTKSVVFCSFGSHTCLNKEQIIELALGLELTGLPFILVLNFPMKSDPKAELEHILPNGFIGRVQNRGYIYSGWVQQQKILAHDNVGCYVCHVGFSSVQEAIMNECQVVMLPLLTDQLLNAKLVSGDLKAGIEVNRRDEDGYFGKEDVREAVRTVMVDVDKEPGKSIRENHKKWSDYLKNYELHDKYITNMVSELKALVLEAT